MKDNEIKRAIREVAKGAMDYARRKGYGLGELGRYWLDEAEEYTEVTSEINRIAHGAEELAFHLEDLGIKSFN